ncbi:uncharacterized protein LOC124898824 [Capsicum annuum]|uniref:uncharacterized protein LOC124898824 n=1 Tax=Capsicum annuum TaxID=4072 RepID=UPI001FB1506E|nr:uncharacterized protein LOC124898824 [Capsicum annuum]
MDFLAKHLLSGKTEMVKAVDSEGTISAGTDAEANYLEQQMRQLSTTLNLRKAITLPSDMIQNLRTDGSCTVITTRSGKILSGPSMGKAVEKERLKNKEDNEKFSKLMTIMKQLTVNLPLMEPLEQMTNYAKFMKELLTKKRKVSCEPIDNIHHCGAVSSQSLVQKEPDPGAFTIPCTVGSIKFTKALCDLGASINLMPLDIYKNLGLGDPTPTTMRLVMANRLMKWPVGVLHDVPVKVADFILPADFVILDCDVDFEVPIILGIPLLSTGRVLVDMELNELKFRYGKKEARFKIQPPMKQLEEMNIFLVVDVF